MATVKKHHQRTIDRIHVLVRLELANPHLNATEIAALAGLSIVRYSILKQHLLYKQVHNQYLSGVLSGLDTQVKETLQMKAVRDTLEFAVPVAMQALLKQALQEKDLRVQNKACNDLLDRHGRFAKVTRINVTEDGNKDAGEDKDTKIASDLAKAIQKGKIPTTPPSIQDPSVSDLTQ